MPPSTTLPARGGRSLAEWYLVFLRMGVPVDLSGHPEIRDLFAAEEAEPPLPTRNELMRARKLGVPIDTWRVYELSLKHKPEEGKRVFHMYYVTLRNDAHDEGEQWPCDSLGYMMWELAKRGLLHLMQLVLRLDGRYLVELECSGECNACWIAAMTGRVDILDFLLRRVGMPWDPEPTYWDVPSDVAEVPPNTAAYLARKGLSMQAA